MNYRSLSKNNLLKFFGIGATTAIVLKILTSSLTTTSFLAENLYFQETKKHEKLVSVQLVTRHGARTPLHLIPGIEEVSLIYWMKSQ